MTSRHFSGEKATKKDANGYYSFKPKPGFGIELDTSRLEKISELKEV